MAKTLVIGASMKPERYSNMAMKQLMQHGHTVFAIGVREGFAHGVHIQNEKPLIESLHTVTLYINPSMQKSYYNYILSLKPKRLIFNPGTENSEFEKLATNAGIECQNACTLVLLSTNQY